MYLPTQCIYVFTALYGLGLVNVTQVTLSL
jgi:hypothetical protein